jgi:3-oxoacyl-[acyl-carrier protein] reductase
LGACALKNRGAFGAVGLESCYLRDYAELWFARVIMDLQLGGRTALVTGASMGIGRAIARGLAAEGVRLAAVARRKEKLEELAAEIAAAKGVPPILIVQDVMAPDAASRIRDQALQALGSVDILVNSAGGSRPLPIDAPEERWEEALTLNFTRVRQLTHAILPGMMARKWGRIVNITGKSEPDRINAAFVAKAGIHSWAKGLSREVGKLGITVNSIAPGRIMSEQIRRNYPPEERKRFAEQEIPVGAYGEPEDLAVLAVFLCSPLARYITGTVIPVDGGLRRYQF